MLEHDPDIDVKTIMLYFDSARCAIEEIHPEEVSP
jgi:hypothetical protein